MDPDPDADTDPSIFITYLQDANKKLTFLKNIIFQTKKVKKKSKNSRRNQGFSYYFCLMIEGSGSGAGSISIPLTNGSGSRSRRPKNMWIRFIRSGFGSATLLCRMLFDEPLTGSVHVPDAWIRIGLALLDPDRNSQSESGSSNLELGKNDFGQRKNLFYLR
jgi:hypothetical protein